MKRLFLSLLLLLSFTLPASADWVTIDFKNCTATFNMGTYTRTIPLYGKVRIVTDPDECEDLSVRIAPKWGRMNVKVVESGADECGEWQWVTSGEDFTVRFVEELDDFSITFTNDRGSTYY
jgi:hypothetical protein